MRNFAFPYFSRDIAEFWRKWHISLTTWFRDYIYIPLGGSRASKIKVIRNTFIVYLVSGFWHGANWTFIVWGLINAIYFLPLLIANKNRKYLDVVAVHRTFPSLKELFQMVSTFTLVMFAWIFFRAESISQAINYIKRLFSSSLFNMPTGLNLKPYFLGYTLFFSLILIGIEWVNRDQQYGLQKLPKQVWSRYIIYLLIIICIFYYGGSQQSFIYFQF